MGFKMAIIQFALIIIIAGVFFIAGLLLSQTNPSIKAKADYFTGPKKLIQVFQSRELELDQQKQREEKDKEDQLLQG